VVGRTERARSGVGLANRGGPLPEHRNRARRGRTRHSDHRGWLPLVSRR
jgi:hypothetical protein